MLYKKSSHKSLPKTAIVADGVASWVGRDGKQKSAPLTADGKHVITESTVWRARWSGPDGRMHDQSTGCRMRSAASRWLSERLREAELIRVGVVTSAEVEQGKAQSERLADLVTRYGQHLDLCGRSPRYKKERDEQLTLVFNECGFNLLRDLDRGRFEKWLIDKRDSVGPRRPQGMGAARRNIYRSAMVQFASWLVQENMLMINPFTAVPVASERTDRRHVRRAFTEAELKLLFDAAARRPLDKALTANRGEEDADLDPRTKRKLTLLGRERALVYRTLFLTGLRKGELRSVTVADCDLDVGVIHLRASNEKSRRGATIPLRDDLVAMLRDHLRSRDAFEREEVIRTGNPAMLNTATTRPLLDVPTSLDKILTRDLAYAGIAKVDPRGRCLDVHSLRVSLATHLARGGVPLRTAMEIMRHSDPKLTAKVYTDPELLDTRGALDALPSISQGALKDTPGRTSES